MIKLSETTKIYILSNPVDMRKSIDGLTVLVVELLETNPQEGSLFLFYNKSKDKVKGLVWHKNGFMLFYKRLEQSRFKFTKSMRDTSITISYEQLQWLLAGLDFVLMNQFPELNFKNYA